MELFDNLGPQLYKETYRALFSYYDWATSEILKLLLAFFLQDNVQEA